MVRLPTSHKAERVQSSSARPHATQTGRVMDCLRRAFLSVPLAAMLALLPTAVPRASERSTSAPPLIGTPQSIKDLHWGDVLFYFYQGEYLPSLTRLGA